MAGQMDGWMDYRGVKNYGPLPHGTVIDGAGLSNACLQTEHRPLGGVDRGRPGRETAHPKLP